MTLKESTAQDTALAAKASPQVPDQGAENDGKKQHSKAFLVLAAMGPGIVTAMAGNDAGGISTYSMVCSIRPTRKAPFTYPMLP